MDNHWRAGRARSPPFPAAPNSFSELGLGSTTKELLHGRFPTHVLACARKHVPGMLVDITPSYRSATDGHVFPAHERMSSLHPCTVADF